MNWCNHARRHKSIWSAAASRRFSGAKLASRAVSASPRKCRATRAHRGAHAPTKRKKGAPTNSATSSASRLSRLLRDPIALAGAAPTRENALRWALRFLGWFVLRQGRMTVAENQMPEQKSVLVIRAPLSEDGWASIYFSSNDGRQMSEREWWHLKQVVELASRAFAGPEQQPKAQSATAGG